MSLEFNYDLYPSEVINLIKADKLDEDIKEYIYELIDMGELKKNRDIKEYFELNCLSEQESEVYLSVGACMDENQYESMTRKEKELHNEFQLRILMIYQEILERRITENYVLNELNLTRGQILTLDTLDEKISSVLLENQETNLGQGMEATEILEDGYYAYCNSDDDLQVDKVRFEVINNTGDIDSLIKII